MDRWQLEPDDVLELVGDYFESQTVFKAEKVEEFLSHCIEQKHHHNKGSRLWLKHGIPCKLLSAKAIGWQKGKVKITIEFIRDET